ncbi:unnamed protein product [Phytophthora fragariaefolia]|uniref:Unnamed protein product n=1 Tax=Phytophthora fragariaefolia TaxID=1490495 RepID=A0A9W6WKK6_9STRA|nr:unnamed protein product [Phytophthora fragariaefolia]
MGSAITPPLDPIQQDVDMESSESFRGSKEAHPAPRTTEGVHEVETGTHVARDELEQDSLGRPSSGDTDVDMGARLSLSAE